MYWLYAVSSGVWGQHHVPAKLLKTSANLGGSDRFEGEMGFPLTFPPVPALLWHARQLVICLPSAGNSQQRCSLRLL